MASLSLSILPTGIPAWAIWLGSSLGLLFLLYRWALPKPIPGIKYNPEAVKSIFGDMGAMVKHTKETQELYDWMVAQNLKLQSPIIQLFVRPLGKPWVVITDYREAQDVLVRRTKQFVKSDWFAGVSGGVMPESHIFMKTTERFKRQRRWIQGVMTPTFLNTVAAYHIYHVCTDLMTLWEQKSRLAQGRPFDAAQDINRAALDAIWTIVFGSESSKSITRAQLELYSGNETVDLPASMDAPVKLPSAPYPPAIHAVHTLTQSIETGLKSPIPWLAHWALRQTKGMKEAFRSKDIFIGEEIAKSLRRSSGQSKDAEVTCAIDDMLRKEISLAEKENREAALHTTSIYDEILSLLIAAHDTTSTAISWMLKFMADNQDVQKKLREELRASYPDAAKERRPPTIREITNITAHYRDAVMEEVFRCSQTEAAISRTAVEDTQILGHHIPKGTEVFFMSNGPSTHSPAFHIDESLRTPACSAAKDHLAWTWDPKTMAVFDPERWLSVNESGQKVFNPANGPLLTFGLGERGCYGRRMAYTEMRVFLTLIIWTYSLEKCPEELSGYRAIDKLVHAPQQCYIRPVKL
ncbi:cytochrome P450 monooxygenase, partial [Hypoxylon sp. FL0543]